MVNCISTACEQNRIQQHFVPTAYDYGVENVVSIPRFQNISNNYA